MNWRKKIGLGLILVLLLAAGSSCASQDFDSRLEAIAGPYRFSTVKWESTILFNQARTLFSQPVPLDNSVDTVINYFAAMRRIRIIQAALASGNKDTSLQAELSRLLQETSSVRPAVDRIIKRQVGDTLAQQGIFNPVDKYVNVKFLFPPINFEIAEPPHLLIVSSRERILELKTVTLRQDLSLAQAEDIENKTDALNVSSLVEELGGYAGTYPVFVSDQAGLQSTIDTVAHEWLHQYLAFRPLGFAYVLDLTGVAPDRDIATMNETVASMFGREVAALVYGRYYQAYLQSPPPRPSGNNFNRQMRDIRLAVEQYLGRGDVSGAEAFMEQKRQALAAQGYYIRKLNQAYFAFHGTYADSPASINPIGAELKTLRDRQKSLKDFVEVVSVMTGPEALIGSIK
ncbi:MAG: hypothetical protein Q7R57_07900 [Dehalococcoidales bacterium]|nr:hypothetical protein [Dehalococcoidales bacterium]